MFSADIVILKQGSVGMGSKNISFSATFDRIVKYTIMRSGTIDFGQYLLELRTKAGYSQKKVADKLGIDISLLSKIEHGERFVQSHMLEGISELFNLSLKNLHIAFLKQKIEPMRNPVNKSVKIVKINYLKEIRSLFILNVYFFSYF